MMLIGLRLALDLASIVVASDVIRADWLLRDGAWMGPVLGVALVYLGALAICWAGRWFSGAASFLWVESAVAWAGLPSIAGLLLWIPESILFGPRAFLVHGPEWGVDWAAALFLVSAWAIKLITVAWSLILLLNCLAEVQRYSLWEASGNLVLAAAAVLVPIVPSATLVLTMRGEALGQLSPGASLVLPMVSLAVITAAAFVAFGTLVAVGFMASGGRAPAWFVRFVNRSLFAAPGGPPRRPRRTDGRIGWVPFPYALGSSLALAVLTTAVVFPALFREPGHRDQVADGFRGLFNGLCGIFSYFFLFLSVILHFRPNSDRRIKYELFLIGLARPGRGADDLRRPDPGLGDVPGPHGDVGSIEASELRRPGLALWSVPAVLRDPLLGVPRAREADPGHGGPTADGCPVGLPGDAGHTVPCREHDGGRDRARSPDERDHRAHPGPAGDPALHCLREHDGQPRRLPAVVPLRRRGDGAGEDRHAGRHAIHPRRRPHPLTSGSGAALPEPEGFEMTRFSTSADVDWQDWVVEHLSRCSLVVMDATLGTEGVQWELDQIYRRVPRLRIAILLKSDAEYEAPDGVFVLRYRLGGEGERAARRAVANWLRSVRQTSEADPFCWRIPVASR